MSEWSKDEHGRTVADVIDAEILLGHGTSTLLNTSDCDIDIDRECKDVSNQLHCLETIENIEEDDIIYASVPFEPNRAGVYILLQRSVIMYVGKTGDIYARLAGHINEGRKRWDAVTFIPIQDEETRDKAETLLIAKWKPPYNVSKTRIKPVPALEMVYGA